MGSSGSTARHNARVAEQNAERAREQARVAAEAYEAQQRENRRLAAEAQAAAERAREQARRREEESRAAVARQQAEEARRNREIQAEAERKRKEQLEIARQAEAKAQEEARRRAKEQREEQVRREMEAVEAERRMMEARSTKEVPKIPDGHLQVGDVLGSGGRGVVYHSTLRNQGKVASKALNSSGAANSTDTMRNFGFEAENLHRLQGAYPKVPKLHGVGKATLPGGEVSLIVMEVLNGKDLFKLVEGSPQEMGGRRVAQLGMGMVDCLSEVHRLGYAHRDIKPHNFILVTQPTERVVLIDFDNASKVGTMVPKGTGTPGFICPTAADDDGADVQALAEMDIFSLAISFYVMLIGKDPLEELMEEVAMEYVGTEFAEGYRPPWPPAGSISSEWKKLVEDCWHGVPANRPSLATIRQRLAALA